MPERIFATFLYSMEVYIAFSAKYILTSDHVSNLESHSLHSCDTFADNELCVPVMLTCDFTPLIFWLLSCHGITTL